MKRYVVDSIEGEVARVEGYETYEAAREGARKVAEAARSYAESHDAPSNEHHPNPWPCDECSDEAGEDVYECCVCYDPWPCGGAA